MRNVKIETKGNTLSITSDITVDLGPSASGKTNIIGTTGGAAKVLLPDGSTISVNVTIYKARG